MRPPSTPTTPSSCSASAWPTWGRGTPPRRCRCFQRSRRLGGPGGPFGRKLFALLAEGHRRLGQPREGLAACRAGRARWPDDVELLFTEGVLLGELGDPPTAESCLSQALQASRRGYFAPVDTGLFGHRTRHHLALTYRLQGRAAEAESQWRTALAERPGYAPARLGLAELLLEQKRWAELGELLAPLRLSAQAEEAGLLEARADLARGRYLDARRKAEELCAAHPALIAPPASC